MAYSNLKIGKAIYVNQIAGMKEKIRDAGLVFFNTGDIYRSDDDPGVSRQLSDFFEALKKELTPVLYVDDLSSGIKGEIFRRM